jgi:hypothetical protein
VLSSVEGRPAITPPLSSHSAPASVPRLCRAADSSSGYRPGPPGYETPAHRDERSCAHTANLVQQQQRLHWAKFLQRGIAAQTSRAWAIQ